MDAKELRLGNWVKTTISRWRGQGFPILAIKGDRVSFDKLNDGQYIWVMAENLKPIPLSPEIIEKCGFEKHKNSNDYWTIWYLKNGWRIQQAHNSEVSASVRSGLFYYSDDFVEVEYLHQLQNLYFALTGEELEVNLTV